MKNKIIQLLCLIVALLLCFAFASCDGDDSSSSSSSSSESESSSSSSSSSSESESSQEHEHTYEFTSTVAVACDTDGFDTYTCTTCYHTKVENVVKAPGHAYKEASLSNAPTPFATGSYAQVCATCNYSCFTDIPRVNATFTYEGTALKIDYDSEGMLSSDTFSKNLADFPNITVVGTPVASNMLTSVIVGENIIELDSYAFTGEFPVLTTVRLGAEIKKIGVCAFDDLDALERVYFAGDAPELSYAAFSKSDDGEFIVVASEGKSFDGLLFGEMVIERPWIEKPQLDLSTLSIGAYSLLAANKASELSVTIADLYAQKGQSELVYFPYSKTIDDFKIIREFALELTKDCTTDKEKVDTVYDWIVDNIIYDDAATKYEPYQVLATKRAVCAGYTTLMHDMLCALEIKSFYVRGTPLFATPYTSETIYTLDRMEIASHAWLSIEIAEGEYAFYDPTYGVENKETYKAMSTEELGAYMISFSVNGIEAIIDGADYSMYDIPDLVITFLHDDGYLYAVNFGEISKEETSADYYNYWFAEAIMLNKKNSNYQAGYDAPEYSVFNCGVVNGRYNNVSVYFALADGRIYEYKKVAELANFLNSECSKDISLENERILDINGMVYSFYGDHYTLALCYSRNEQIVVPSTLNGYPVTTISSGAFSENTYVKRITIEEGIGEIWVDAFYGCESLEYIYFSKTVQYNTTSEQHTKVSSISFDRCYSLKEIVVDSENPYLKSVDGNLYSKDMKELIAYAPNNDKKSFTVPEGVEKIERVAFAYSNIESIVFPSTLKTIGDFAFQYSKLKSVTVPASLEVGNYAFGYAICLESVTFEEGITEIPYGMFTKCQSLIEVNFPSTLRTIGEFAFNVCSRLYKIEIPEGVTKIEGAAFCDSSLVSITLPSTLREIGEDAFYGARVLIINNLSPLVFEKNSEDYGKIALVAQEINSTVDNSHLFVTDAGLVFYSRDDVTILAEYIAMGAEELVLPATFNGKTYTLIDKAFADDSKIGWIRFDVFDIYEWFEDGVHSGKGITSIVIPNTIKVIPMYAFTGWDALEYIYFEGTEQEWNEMIIVTERESNIPIINATVIFNS